MSKSGKNAGSHGSRHVRGGPAGRHPGDSKAVRGAPGRETPEHRLTAFMLGRPVRPCNAGERPGYRGPAGKSPGRQGGPSGTGKR